MSFSRPVAIAGLAMVAAGILLPRSAFIGAHAAGQEELIEQLLIGALLFKAGLVFSGLFLILAARHFGSQPGNGTHAGPRELPRSTIGGILGALLLVSLVMRLYALNAGLWLDEILTFVDYARVPFVEIATTYASENQHFLYSLLAHASLLAFGDHGWALRLPAVLFGVAGVGALYLFGSRVTSRREALFAATLLAFSYHHVWFSQNARGYTGLLFWTLISSWLLIEVLERRRASYCFYYAAACALGVYTHATMLFVVLGQFCAYLLWVRSHRRRHKRRILATPLFAFVGAGALSFQLHAIVVPQMLSEVHATASVVADWRNPLWTLLEFARGAQMSFAGGLFAMAALLVFCSGLASYARSNPILLQLLFIPPLAGTIVLLAMNHHVWPRFYFFAFGFAALVAIRGAATIARVSSNLFRLAEVWPGRLASLLCWGMITVSAIAVPRAYGPKQDYEGALEFVESARTPGDAVVTVSLARFPYTNLYRDHDWQPVDDVRSLDAVRSGARQTWLVYTLEPVVASMYPEIMESIRRDFTVVRRFPGTLRGGTVFVCRSTGAESMER